MNPAREEWLKKTLTGMGSLLRPSEAHPADRPLKLSRRVTLFLLTPLAVLITRALGLFPGAVEHFYAECAGPAITRSLSALFGWTTVNLTGVIVAVVVLWLFWPAPRAAYHVVKGHRRTTNALLCGTGRFAATFGILVATFYPLWGINYARPVLIERMGWNDPFTNKSALPPMSELADELARLCANLVDETNRAYLDAVGSEDLGRPSGDDLTWDRINGSLDTGYRRVQEQLELVPSFREGRGPAKQFYVGRLLSAMGISGFYFPWSAEANVNPSVPGCQMPHVTAHEKAHQRGISSEDEANFFGYLACVMSGDEYLRYSGLLFAQRQLLTVLLQLDAERGEALVKQRLPGVRRDVTDMKAYWRQFEGPVRTASLAVNNAYLKANRVEGGLMSYSLSAKLLFVFARENGGSCVPDKPEQRN